MWNWPIGAVVAWARWLVSPSELVRSCLHEMHDNGNGDWKIVIVKFWAFPIVLSMAVDAALVLHAYTSEIYTQPTALLLHFVYTCLKWLVAAAAIKFLLRLLHLSSNFDIIVACYSIIVIYAPIYSILEAPAAYYQMSILSNVKAQHLDFVASIKYVLSHLDEFKRSEFQERLFPILADFNGLLVLVTSALVAESLSVYLLNDRFKTYITVWLSSIVSFFPMALLNLIRIGMVYSYI